MSAYIPSRFAMFTNISKKTTIIKIYYHLHNTDSLVEK